MKNKKYAVDFGLFFSTIILVSIGIIMVYSSSWPIGLDMKNNALYFFKRQVIFSALGFIAMIITMNIPYKLWERYAFSLFLLSIGTALLLLTPLGVTDKGATRWVGLFGFTFMPGDLIKVGSIFYFAKFLTNKQKDIKSFKHGTLPGLLIVAFVFASVFLQNDLGTALILSLSLMGMFFVGGINLAHLGILTSMAGGGAFLIIKKLLSESGEEKSFRASRIAVFRDPFKDPQGFGYQGRQSLMAIGTGGLKGIGLGKSRQKYYYLPEAYNDFIFSIIIEELGLIGAAIVILTYIILISRGIKIAINCEDDFGSFLAAGITALIGFQTFIHIAVGASLIPTTGVTLPFISYGGTSLLIFMTCIGILLNISRTIKKE